MIWPLLKPFTQYTEQTFISETILRSVIFNCCWLRHWYKLREIARKMYFYFPTPTSFDFRIFFIVYPTENDKVIVMYKMKRKWRLCNSPDNTDSRFSRQAIWICERCKLGFKKKEKEKRKLWRAYVLKKYST